MGELEFAHKNLFDALGMNSVVWGMDPQGVADGGNGIAMTVQDAARFGQLYLQGGQWNGEQLIPAQWVEQSTTAKNNGAGDATNGGFAPFRAMTPFTPLAHMDSLSLWCRSWS